MDETAHGPDRPSPGSGPGELIIREPEDLLGYIPHSMGEWPSESLVAVTLGSGTLGVTVRVDLPSASGADELEAYAEAVGGYLSTDALADGAVLAVYTAEPWVEIAAPPRHDLVTALQSALGRVGLPVLDAWLVGERHWRSILCRRTACCPWPGELLDTITTSRLSAELVYRGSTFGPLAVAGRGRTAADGPGGDRAKAAEASLLERCRADPRAWWDPSEFAAALAAWDDTLGDSRPPGEDRLALLAASLVRPALRDAVIVAAALSGRVAWRGTVAFGLFERPVADADDEPAAHRAGALEVAGPLPELPGGLPGAEVGRLLAAWTAPAGPAGDVPGATPPPLSDVEPALSFGAVLLGSTHDTPDWERIARLERALRALSAMEEPEVRAPALALLGWIQWVRGRGARASGFLRRALSASPGYRFAELFARVVESGELAAWARRPETAWRRLSDVA